MKDKTIAGNPLRTDFPVSHFLVALLPAHHQFVLTYQPTCHSHAARSPCLSGSDESDLLGGLFGEGLVAVG